jgi:hypothetical protein
MPMPSPPFKTIWNWFCGMAFRALVGLLLIPSMSSEFLPFNICFIFGNRKCHWGLDPVNRWVFQRSYLFTSKKLPHRQCRASMCIVVMQDTKTQTIIDPTPKEPAIDQQQYSCETLICQRHQTILRFSSTVATASRKLRVCEFYCQTSYTSVGWPHAQISALRFTHHVGVPVSWRRMQLSPSRPAARHLRRCSP